MMRSCAVKYALEEKQKGTEKEYRKLNTEEMFSFK
jgi:hypothetical protein